MAKNPSLALRALIRKNILAYQSPERKRVGFFGTLNTYLEVGESTTLRTESTC